MLKRLRNAGPVVLVDAYSSVNGYDSVLSDNVGGASRAVKYLLDHGHRQIGPGAAGAEHAERGQIHVAAGAPADVTVIDPHKVPVEDARVWSSIGGEAKKVAGGWQLRTPRATAPFLRHYLEVKPTKLTRAQLERGQRLTELLKQPQYAPLPIERQVTIIYAGTNGYIDGYPLSAIGRYEAELLSLVKARKADLLTSIKSTGTLDAGIEKQLRDALDHNSGTLIPIQRRSRVSVPPQMRMSIPASTMAAAFAAMAPASATASSIRQAWWAPA